MNLLIVFFLSLHAGASAGDLPLTQATALASESPAWFVCEADRDRVDVRYPCAGATVNKKYAAEARAHYGQENAVRNCIVTPPANDAPPFKVFCKQKKCGSEGRNPKLGFS
jgi:hypothetical protein